MFAAQIAASAGANINIKVTKDIWRRWQEKKKRWKSAMMLDGRTPEKKRSGDMFGLDGNWKKTVG